MLFNNVPHLEFQQKGEGSQVTRFDLGLFSTTVPYKPLK